MQKRITFRGMEHSPTLEEQANQQLQKIEKFLSKEASPIFIDIIFEAYPTHAHNKVEVRIKSPNYQAVVSKKEGEEIYKVLGFALDAAYSELRKQKEKLVDRHKQGCANDCSKKHFEEGATQPLEPDDEAEINNFDNEFEFDLLEEQYDTVVEPKRNLITLPSGLEYEVIYEPAATAQMPREGQTVTIHYAAWLNDNGLPGKKIVLNHSEKLTFVVGSDQVIKGLDDAILTMRMGEQRRLFIPVHLGYGKKGLERIVPPNVPLIFDVELIKID